MLLVLSAAKLLRYKTDKGWLKKSAPEVNSGRVDGVRSKSYFLFQIWTPDGTFDA